MLLKIIKSVNQKGFFHVLIANLLFALVAFGSQLLVAKFLTEQELGFIKIFQSTTQILGILAGLGFSTSLLVLAANPKNYNRKGDLFCVALFNVIPISIVVWILFMFANYLGFSTKIDQVKILFSDFSFIMIILAITALYTSFFQANRDFKKFSFILIVSKILSLILIVITTYFFGYLGFMHGLWIGLLLTLFIYAFFVKKNYGLNTNFNISKFWDKTKEQLKISIHGLGANIFGNIALNIDIILLGYFYSSNPSLVGQYGFATIFITALGMFQGTIVQVSTPFFSKYINNKIILISVYKKYSLFLLIAACLVLLLCYFTLPMMIKLFYGEKFYLGIKYLEILLFAWFFRSLNAINISFLLGTAKTYVTNYINLIFALLNFTVIFILLNNKASLIVVIYSIITISLLIFIATSILVNFKFLKNK
ncbi:oligosaccharide flippase family protein [Polaribacter batillariae]|uniref:Oligosaccharide flippase family protein n=1 Tax=Polaribacter batillariae TaxID=2808900 RepID=A0ABX7SVG1_9FLAO|nr:oligosaccharide flippase family protein [Polaribacter batillariae]QTD37308.1 oligosaccharide flippase family protein [Polaribacter batillariae]